MLKCSEKFACFKIVHFPTGGASFQAQEGPASRRYCQEGHLRQGGGLHVGGGVAEARSSPCAPPGHTRPAGQVGFL